MMYEATFWAATSHNTSYSKKTYAYLFNENVYTVDTC